MHFKPSHKHIKTFALCYIQGRDTPVRGRIKNHPGFESIHKLMSYKQALDRWLRRR